MTRTTQLEIILQNYSHIIKPGMFASVVLVLNGKSSAMIIPFDAVLGESEKFVFVSANGIAVKKVITIGIQQDNNVEVTGGLSAEDRVITVGQRVVKEGIKIEESK